MIADDALEEVSRETEVGFEITDDRFDGGPASATPTVFLLLNAIVTLQG